MMATKTMATNKAACAWLTELAVVLEYPDASTEQRCKQAAEMLAKDYADISKALSTLADWLSNAERGEAEEWYSRMFDLSPVCTLNIGYHLFGEQYERGAFLAGLVSEHRDAGLELPADLPDHLPAVLRLLGHLDKVEDAADLVSHAVLPALARMLGDLSDSKAPWVAVLQALPAVLESVFDTVGISEEKYPTREKTFLGQRKLPIESLSMSQPRRRRDNA